MFLGILCYKGCDKIQYLSGSWMMCYAVRKESENYMRMGPEGNWKETFFCLDNPYFTV
jgi:hypothetical protein